jgi:hypothetical protein
VGRPTKLVQWEFTAPDRRPSWAETLDRFNTSGMDVRPSASEWPWPPELDALIAATDSHRLLLENDRVRVLEVVIEPGAREPEHTHRWPSVMIVDKPARIRYYEHGIQTFESPASDTPQPGPKAIWMDAEGPHSVENIDSSPYIGCTSSCERR